LPSPVCLRRRGIPWPKKQLANTALKYTRVLLGSKFERTQSGLRVWARDITGVELPPRPLGISSMAKLLLIEDNKETADEIRAELGDHGFEVDWAANGIEGLDKARSGAAEAMIVDRLLPGMDGLTIIEALRHEGICTPVLVLSALRAVDDRVRGLRAGGDDYLTSQGLCP
jgi:CheY-like chemotaxis protein